MKRLKLSRRKFLALAATGAAGKYLDLNSTMQESCGLKRITMRNVVIGFFGMILWVAASPAAAGDELKDEAERINYSVGYQIGGDFKSQGVDLRPEILVRGIRDALNNSAPLLSGKEIDATLIGLKKKIVADQRSKGALKAAELRRTAAAFLAENGKRKGVTILPSGVQYEVLRPGSGKRPLLSDEVMIHYRVTSVDGREMGSTYPAGNPRPFPVAKTVPGLQEVLPLMGEGAKWKVVLPTGTAAGGREPKGDAGPLIYEVELLAVLAADRSSEPQAVKDSMPQK
jgi:FKBP-type peptidyl-prolyl cis-trans isomerase FklB